MYAIMGGYDDLSKLFFDDLKKIIKQSIFINFNKSKTKKEKYI